MSEQTKIDDLLRVLHDFADRPKRSTAFQEGYNAALAELREFTRFLESHDGKRCTAVSSLSHELVPLLHTILNRFEAEAKDLSVVQ